MSKVFRNEILDKTDLRKEFPDIVNAKCVKRLSHTETIPFVGEVINVLKTLSCYDFYIGSVRYFAHISF